MNKQDCFKLGYISKTHGVKGEVVLLLDVDDSSRYKKIESLFIEMNEKLLLFTIQNIRVGNNKAIVKLEGIDKIEQAQQLNKSSVYLPLSFLPNLGEKNFYFHEIIGYQVNDLHYGNIGNVEAVLEYPHQNLLQVMGITGKQILIPVRNEYIVKVNREHKQLCVNAPEGLIDIYTKGDSSTEEE